MVETNCDSRTRLDGAARDALARYAARATWPAGFPIYQRGAEADGVFLVSRGLVVLRAPVRAGRGFVPAVVGAGETFGAEGLALGGRYATDAKADDETETLFIGSAQLRAIVREQPPLAITLIAQMMAERVGLLDKLHDLTTLSVEQRIAAAIARLAAASGIAAQDGRIVLTPQRYRLLCELVGATRESVSLVLGRFVASGLAERTGSSITLAPAATLTRNVFNGLGDRPLADVAESVAEEAQLVQ